MSSVFFDDSQSEYDDMLMSRAASFADSNASTTASLGDLGSPQFGPLKAKLPSDFGFLTEKLLHPPAKRARKSISYDSNQVEPNDMLIVGKGRKVPCRRAAPSQKQLRITGPEFIRTLRGKLLGREVALVCCGESHQDTIDLTRPGGIAEPKRFWVEVLPSLPSKGVFEFDARKAIKSRKNVTLNTAKEWAEDVLDDKDLDEDDGALLVFEAKVGKEAGTAYVFASDAHVGSGRVMPTNTTLYRWCDPDVTASEYNKRRLQGESIPLEVQDDMIAQRKKERLAEGIEVFDDWLIRQHHQSETGKDPIRVDLILENRLNLSEVELHSEPGVGPAPPAHECLQRIEVDSDESDDEDDPDDGTGCFLDYLMRRCQRDIPPDRLHCVDPRDLGNPEDAAENVLLQGLVTEPLPQDCEAAEVVSRDIQVADAREEGDEKMVNGKKHRKAQGGKAGFRNGKADVKPCPLPSWEAYFGCTASILLYSRHVKIDFVPLFAKCLKSPEKLSQFFDALYFGTVPDAVNQMGLVDEETRSLSRIRSLIQKTTHGGELVQRQSDEGLVPVKAAPVDRYLKARGSEPPRTWVSGLGDKVRSGGCGEVVDAAKKWLWESVLEIVSDKADSSGDYFMNWLRECHNEIYNDVDRTDTEKLRRAKFMPSESGGQKRRHDLSDIRIPNVEEAFKEISKFDIAAGRASTKKQRLLAKILVDAFQLRLVDLASILKAAHIATMAPEGSKVVIVVYAGSDHTKNVISFWEKFGFTSAGLSGKGNVGKENWKDDEGRALKLPSYLHDFRRLFPVPQ
jgi:hypothetical protein